MSETSEQNQADEKKPGGTLDLNNISINTLKDDLAGEAGGEVKEDKSGWFSFLAAHKKEAPASPAAASKTPEATPPSETNIPDQEPVAGASAAANPEPAGDSLDQALDQFKTESQQKAASASVEAPSNLPVSDGSIKTVLETPSTEISLPKTSTPKETEEGPALGSFFPPKEAASEEPEEAPTLTHLAPPLKETGGIGEKVKVGDISPLTQEGIVDKLEQNQPEKEENKNPFSSRIQPVEPEKKSLLQSVESALNYSAPPE